MSMDTSALRAMVEDVVDRARVTDMHTHLFAPEFGSLLLCGADELLTFHYLISESFRVHRMPYSDFWRLSKAEQSAQIWRSLFVENSPLSEAASGVISVARRLGCDPAALSLQSLREALPSRPTPEYVQRVLDAAGVDEIVMTNDPFDPAERACWTDTFRYDPRFYAALRLDAMMNRLEQVCPLLRADGYEVDPQLGGKSVPELKRFLEAWIERTQPVYVAFSVADDFVYPDGGIRGRILDEVVLPVCREHKLALALMVGARRQVNPQLQLAGDSVANASVRPLEALCVNHPDNRFLVTMLSRENQHEIVVAARKFHNLMVFGCWWFVNTDSLVEEITRMRLELLGPTFIAQHSDARVLEQLIYKWDRVRSVLKRVLADKYERLAQDGWCVTRADVERDVDRLVRTNFWDFVRW
ncbi:glucuronate isomerase [Alicyclobacillus contaminans]|uniref:glucuronate isomerase n=1 Tax=Alicyclobacillus contaminans TaxID=392016 RepID=UPI0012EC547A|nr:glucuronate isomerase [Alicyclobacillus contaminans]GMA51409.1 glucuronate isomerase [Alicyclobacillus contaminans]